MKKYPIFLLIFILCFGSTVVLASTTNGTIGASYTSILLDNDAGLWVSGETDTEKIFWDASSPYDVHVTDSDLTGYLWGPGVGWISLNCSNTSSCGSSDFKVANTDAGVLSGYAWGENAGWVSFSCANAETNNCASNSNAKVVIDSDGKFSGYAWSQNFGWIKFDCSSVSSCVQTDWRPASVRNQGNNQGGGGGGSSGGGGGVIQSPISNTPPATSTPITPIEFPGCSSSTCKVAPPKVVYPKTQPEPTNVQVQNNSLVIKPEQTGKLEQEIQKFGKIVVDIADKISSKELVITVENKAEQVDLANVNFEGLPKEGLGYIFHIYAKDSDGVLVQKFDKNILITLPLPEVFLGQKVSVFQRPEDSSKWSRVNIQELTETNVVISVDHLSYFLVTFADDQSNVLNNFSLRWLILIIVIILAILTLVRRKNGKNYD